MSTFKFDQATGSFADPLAWADIATGAHQVPGAGDAAIIDNATVTGEGQVASLEVGGTTILQVSVVTGTLIADPGADVTLQKDAAGGGRGITVNGDFTSAAIYFSALVPIDVIGTLTTLPNPPDASGYTGGLFGQVSAGTMNLGTRYSFSGGPIYAGVVTVGMNGAGDIDALFQTLTARQIVINTAYGTVQGGYLYDIHIDTGAPGGVEDAYALDIKAGHLYVTNTGLLGNNAMRVGESGQATLEIPYGSVVVRCASLPGARPALLVGDGAGSSGTVLLGVLGEPSNRSGLETYGTTTIGAGGVGILTMIGGFFTPGSAGTTDAKGVVTRAATDLTIGDGRASGGTGRGTLSMSGGTLHSLGGIGIGLGGDTGALTALGGIILAQGALAVGAGGGTGSLTLGLGSQMTLAASSGATPTSAALAQGAGSVATVVVRDGSSLLDIGPMLVGGGGTASLSIAGFAGFGPANGMALALGVGSVAGSSATMALTGAATLVTANGQVQIGTGAGASGTLTVSGGAHLRSGNVVLGGANAAVTVTGASYVVGNSAFGFNGVLVDPAGTISGAGSIAGAMQDNGLVVASGGILTVNTVSGTGTAAVSGNAVLRADMLGGPALAFIGTGGTVILGAQAGATSVTGFASGSLLDLQNTAATLAANTVTTQNGASFVFTDLAAGAVVSLASDGHGGTAVTLQLPSSHS